MMAGTFIALMMFVMLGTSDQLTDKYRKADSEIGFANTLLAASDALVLTPGSPPNWEGITVTEGNLQSFGLASAPNVISPAKAARMENLNESGYSAIRAALGLSASNVSIEIMLLGDTAPLYSFGVKPANTSRSSVFERVASLNGSAVLVRLQAG